MPLQRLRSSFLLTTNPWGVHEPLLCERKPPASNRMCRARVISILLREKQKKTEREKKNGTSVLRTRVHGKSCARSPEEDRRALVFGKVQFQHFRLGLREPCPDECHFLSLADYLRNQRDRKRKRQQNAQEKREGTQGERE